MDVQGPSVVKPYTDKFKVAFPVAVDSSDVFGMAFGLKLIPVSYLVDEVGIIRLKGGGPSAEFLKQIETVLAEKPVSARAQAPSLAASRPRSDIEKAAAASPADWESRLALARLLEGEKRFPEALKLLESAAGIQPRNSEVHFAWGLVLLNSGARDAGLARLKHSRDLDPENWRIRKQIWALENPDKFYTGASPDYAWQKEELAREKAASPRR